MSEVELQDGYVYREIFWTFGQSRASFWRIGMLASKTKSPMVVEQKGNQVSDGSGAIGREPKREPKKRGSLAATLDPLLNPRLSAGRPGRPKGAGNYEWTPETDKLLMELCVSKGVAAAKRAIGRKMQERRSGGVEIRPDSVRKAVEYRMAKLGLSTGQKRRTSEMTKAKRWTDSETAALLGALGADATLKSIAARTGHTVKSVRAKLVRLEYQVNEIRGFAEYTVEELAGRIQVTPRQIRRWKEKGWLQTKDRKITDPCLEQFLREHADQIPFVTLPRTEQLHLIDLGYPCPQGKAFRRNVREILEGLGRDRKPRRPARTGHGAEMPSGEGGPDPDGGGSARTVEQSA